MQCFNTYTQNSMPKNLLHKGYENYDGV